MVDRKNSPVLQPFDSMGARIEDALVAHTDLPNGCPSRLREAIRYSLLSPGKRLRPRLVLLAAEACGGSVDAVLPAACAVEMVHAYSLIHDDLPAMDDDSLRRGRPTCHTVYGEALAILAGDALLALAFDVMAHSMQPPETAARCCAELARAAGPTALVGGQVADLASDPRNDDLAALESIHRRKTGAMLTAAVRLGGLGAGATTGQLTALDAYAAGLGLAFQITDDLLDVAGDQDEVGKRVGKDGERGRLTYPALLGIEASRGHAARLIDEACAALHELGPRAAGLEAAARAIPERSH